MELTMRFPSVLPAVALAAIASLAQAQERLNPMIALHEKGLPVFGITHPSLGGGRGGGGGGRGGAATAAGSAGTAVATPPAAPSLADIARETLAYRLGDFQYNSYSAAQGPRFREYMEAIVAQGGGMREHAFISKVTIVAGNVERAQAMIIEQLNAGHAGVFMQRVETAEEVRQAIAAMRFKSKGGVRPDTGIDLAAKYWGLTRAQYLERADVWPINPRGELVVYAIVESKPGVANIREIAKEPGVAAIVVGAGTLGGVYSTTDSAGRRVRDQAGFDAAVASVVAACKEFKVACSYPANNPAEIERLMGMGFSVFTMQRRDQPAFDAIAAGRRISGRPMTPR
jgi:4-hydroxy-2-oxoheptanedioate aldolase